MNLETVHCLSGLMISRSRVEWPKESQAEVLVLHSHNGGPGTANWVIENEWLQEVEMRTENALLIMSSSLWIYEYIKWNRL